MSHPWAQSKVVIYIHGLKIFFWGGLKISASFNLPSPPPSFKENSFKRLGVFLKMAILDAIKKICLNYFILTFFVGKQGSFRYHVEWRWLPGYSPASCHAQGGIRSRTWISVFTGSVQEYNWLQNWGEK